MPLTIEGLDLRDLAVVVPEKGGAGIVVGQAVNRSTSAVEVTFAVTARPPRPPSPCRRAGQDALGCRDRRRDPGIPVAPGTMVELTVTTDQAGANIVKVPVLPNIGYYKDLTASSS